MILPWKPSPLPERERKGGISGWGAGAGGGPTGRPCGGWGAASALWGGCFWGAGGASTTWRAGRCFRGAGWGRFSMASSSRWSMSRSKGWGCRAGAPLSRRERRGMLISGSASSGGGLAMVSCGAFSGGGAVGRMGLCPMRPMVLGESPRCKADLTPWYTASKTGRSLTKRTSIFEGWTFTSTASGGRCRCRAQAGNLPAITAPLQASSKAAQAVRLRTVRPFKKKFCMERLARLPEGLLTKPSTRMPPRV